MGLFADSSANARLRARKSRLRGPDELRLLRAAASAAAFASALAADPARDADRIDTFLFDVLLDDYAAAIEHYPRGAPLFRALLALHEIENLKLAWRAKARSLPRESWVLLWKPLGRLESLRLSDWSEAASLREASRAARGTRYAGIVEEVRKAHESDPAAAELAFDRWSWESILVEAQRLPRIERAAAELALDRVRERDYDTLRRGVAWGRLLPDAAGSATVLLRREGKPETLRALAAWKPGAEPLSAHLPARLLRRLPSVADWEDLACALARQRRQHCRRAFLGYPFRLAAPLAFLLLREEEVRAISALSRARGVAGAEPALGRALAASALET